MSDAEDRWVLEERARRLARRSHQEAAGAEAGFVVFSLAREQYALELAHLRHVFPLSDLALLPGAEPPLMGVTAWRGELIRVLDLTRILDVPQGGPTDRGRVLVLGDDGAAFALLADAILDVTALPVTSLTKLGDQPFIRGVTADAVAVLDGAELIRSFA